MKAAFDGFLSFLAALATLGFCGIPVWFTHKAVEAGVAPQWAYVGVLGLGGIGLLLTIAFLRKAKGGISPTRDRKRR